MYWLGLEPGQGQCCQRTQGAGVGGSGRGLAPGRALQAGYKSICRPEDVAYILPTQLAFSERCIESKKVLTDHQEGCVAQDELKYF